MIIFFFGNTIHVNFMTKTEGDYLIQSFRRVTSYQSPKTFCAIFFPKKNQVEMQVTPLEVKSLLKIQVELQVSPLGRDAMALKQMCCASTQ